MLTREVKLRVNKKLDMDLQSHLWHLTGVYNWALKQIENELKDCESRPDHIGCLTEEQTENLKSLYKTKNKVRLKPLGIETDEHSLQAKVSGNAKKMDCVVSNEAVLSMIYQARNAWDRCLSGLGKKPGFKGNRNRLNGFSFYGDCKVDILNGKIKLPKLGWVKFKKFDIGKHLQGKKISAFVTVKRRADGWYALFRVEAEHQQVVLANKEFVGIDPGMKSVVTLSNGVTVEKSKRREQAASQMARIQKGISKNYELAKRLRTKRNAYNPASKVARIQLKLARQLKHQNHQISHDIVRDFKNIFWSDDSFKGQQVLFGKSILANAPGMLREMIAYKSSSCGRQFKLVSNVNSTVTCSSCKSLTGPKGVSGLKVREWVCSGCGARNDRDRNAAIHTLNLGLESSLEQKGLVEKLTKSPKETKLPSRKAA
jgi:putative transposase